MGKSLFNEAITFVVALLMLQTVVSCVDEKYELSEDTIDTTVTVFQEGLCLPLGSTGKITLGSLYEQLDDETKELLKEMEGAYMFHMADTYDLTSDITGALSDIGSFDAIKFDEKFSVSLSDVDLSALDIEPSVIGPEIVNVSEMLDIPDINSYLPQIDEYKSFGAKVPTLTEDDLRIDMSGLGDEVGRETRIAWFGDGGLGITDEIAESAIGNKEMDYVAIRQQIWNLFRVELPQMQEWFEFEDYVLEIPVEIVLPAEIKSVKSIDLNKDASFELSFEIINSLFTGGSIVPELNVDLHEIFEIDAILNGEQGSGIEGDGLAQYVKDKFVLSPESDWRASHRYHIKSLNITEKDWSEKEEGHSLRLNKTFKVTMGGKLTKNELVTTLKHLHDNGGEEMKIRMDVKFHNLEIDDIRMEVEPIVESESFEMPLNIDPIEIPSVVRSIDYVDFDDNSQLSISMNAVAPSVCEDMNLTLKKLTVEFPEGLEVKLPAGSSGNLSGRLLTYENVSLVEGLDEQVIVDKMDLPEIQGGMLAYSGQVKVVAVAQADGVLSSKKLLSESGEDISVTVSVDYKPVLTDYCATIDNYEYPVEVEPIIINETLDAEVGKFLKDSPVYVSLKQDVPGENQKIVITLDYPEHKAIKVQPLPEEGLKIDFPDLLVFTQASKEEYNITEGNVIHYNGNDIIPREIVLEIESIKVEVENPEGTDEYFVKDELTVSGGVCLAGTQIRMSDIEELKNMDAKVEFGASVPRLSPAQFDVDEYKVTIEENIPVEAVEIELPDMIKSIEVSDLLLKDVYLELEVDASSVKKIAGDADIRMCLDICLPSEIMVEQASEDNVLHIEENVNEDFKIVLTPIHVKGLDLSALKVEDGKLSMKDKEVKINGYVELKNLSIDVENLEGKNIDVAVSGSLSSRGDDGSASGSISIDKINGHVGLEIDPVNTSIDLSSLAETLNGDNISLTIDINRYWLSLDVNTNFDIPVSGTLDITPWYGGEPGKKETKTIEMDPAKREGDMYRFYISNRQPTASGLEYIELDLISMLYKKVEGSKPVIADSLQVSLNAGVDAGKTCTIEPSKDYTFKVDYALGVPLEFGQDFVFEYRDTIAELPDVAAQILEFGSVGLGGKVTNSFPINLDLQVRPLDSKGNVIPLKEDAGKLKIASCDAMGNPVTTKLNFVISGKGADLSDMKSLELVFTIDSKESAGVPLKPDSFIQVQLSALVPDGVTFDAKEFLSSDDEDQDNQN